MKKCICVCFLIVISFFVVSKTKFSKEKVVVQDNHYLSGIQSKSDRYFIHNNVIKSGYFLNPKSSFAIEFQVDNSEKINYTCDNSTNYMGTGCNIQLIGALGESKNYSLVIYGDVNGNGNRTITDLVQIARHLNGSKELSNEIVKMAADVNQDGEITMDDVSALSSYILSGKNIPVKNDTDSGDVGITIKLSTNSVSINKNETFKVDATINREDVSIIKWTSEDESIAVVDNNGLITGLKEGTTKITVTTSDSSTASVFVKVTVLVPTTGVSLNKQSASLNVKDVMNLVATITPSDASDKTLTWSSSNTNIAEVDQNGHVTTHDVTGTAVIKVVTTNGKSAQCTITVVRPVTGVSLNKKSGSLDKGGTLTLTATVQPSNASNKKVSWSSSDTSIATVDQNGKVKAKKVGTVNIIAKTDSGGKQAKFTLQVKTGYTVLINPSHQAQNPTQSSKKGYKTEKDSMYELAYVVNDVLVTKGYDTFMSNKDGSINKDDNCFTSSDGDRWDTCGPRQIGWLKNKSNNAKTIYVALHSNASNGKGMGPLVLYYSKSSKGKTLATNLCNRLYNLYKNNKKTPTISKASCVSGQTGYEPSMYHTSGGKGVAVLIEVGFHDNANNQKFIQDKSTEIAESIVNAINSYIG